MDKKVALVTGAGSGVGKAVTLALLRAGYHVALAGRRAEALEQTVVEAGEAGEHALAIPPISGTRQPSVRSLPRPRRRLGGWTCSSTTRGLSAMAPLRSSASPTGRLWSRPTSRRAFSALRKPLSS